MPKIKESSNNHFVRVGNLFAKEAQQRVIKKNGQLVTPESTSGEKSKEAISCKEDKK